MYDSLSTVAYIVSRFPTLADHLLDEDLDGLLHVQIGAFSHFSQATIDEQDAVTWERVVETFMELWKDCSADVTNALNVSFLEHLNFKDNRHRRAWAYEAMPNPMREAWDAMERYNREIHGG